MLSGRAGHAESVEWQHGKDIEWAMPAYLKKGKAGGKSIQNILRYAVNTSTVKAGEYK